MHLAIGLHQLFHDGLRLAFPYFLLLPQSLGDVLALAELSDDVKHSIVSEVFMQQQQVLRTMPSNLFKYCQFLKNEPLS